MVTHSSILVWEIPWTEEPGGYSPWGCRRVGHDLVTQTTIQFVSLTQTISDLGLDLHKHAHRYSQEQTSSCRGWVGEGSGSPRPCSGLRRARGACTW